MATGNHAVSAVIAGAASRILEGRKRSVERRDWPTRERLVDRVLAEFREMPCLRLTPHQAERLFGLRPDVSARIIEHLVRDGHLRQDADGRYACVPGEP